MLFRGKAQRALVVALLPPQSRRDPWRSPSNASPDELNRPADENCCAVESSGNAASAKIQFPLRCGKAAASHQHVQRTHAREHSCRRLALLVSERSTPARDRDPVRSRPPLSLATGILARTGPDGHRTPAKTAAAPPPTACSFGARGHRAPTNPRLHQLRATYNLRRNKNLVFSPLRTAQSPIRRSPLFQTTRPLRRGAR